MRGRFEGRGHRNRLDVRAVPDLLQEGFSVREGIHNFFNVHEFIFVGSLVRGVMTLSFFSFPKSRWPYNLIDSLMHSISDSLK